MGLLDYIKANTPRATTPLVKPGKVFNEGLLNPNAYNKPAADRFKDSMFGLLGVVPGVGDAASAAESADLFNRGENFAGSMAALGALPFVPAMGGILKNSNPDFGAWGVKTGATETLDKGSIKVPFIDDNGDEYGSIVYKETPTEIIIDGLGRSRLNRDHKGVPTRAVKAIIDKAISEGKSVRATSAGFAKNYWGGPMGFKVDPLTDQISPDYIFDASQAEKVLSGDVNSTIWGHERGYGKMFEDIYGPSLKK